MIHLLEHPISENLEEEIFLEEARARKIDNVLLRDKAMHHVDLLKANYQSMTGRAYATDEIRYLYEEQPVRSHYDMRCVI